MKLLNKKIDALLKDLYREETDLNKRKVIKGVKAESFLKKWLEQADDSGEQAYQTNS